MKKLKYLLEQHQITTKIENAKLFVLDVWYSNDGKRHQAWLNATDWTIDFAMTFLGYELIEE